MRYHPEHLCDPHTNFSTEEFATVLLALLRQEIVEVDLLKSEPFYFRLLETEVVGDRGADRGEPDFGPGAAAAGAGCPFFRPSISSRVALSTERVIANNPVPSMPSSISGRDVSESTATISRASPRSTGLVQAASMYDGLRVIHSLLGNRPSGVNFESSSMNVFENDSDRKSVV